MNSSDIGFTTLASVASSGTAGTFETGTRQGSPQETRKQILQAYDALNRAVERADSRALRSMTTADHVCVAAANGEDAQRRRPLYERVKDPGFQGFRRRTLSEVAIDELAPGLAMQRFEAALEGKAGGKALPERVAVTILWQRRDGRWLERFYQHTPLP